jgi:hypothetical protein
MTATTATFTPVQQAAIEALRRDLTQRTQRTVTAEYGSTDCGQHWAALCVDSLPEGSWGVPGPLVSVLVGTGISGAATMGADGSALADGVDFNEAVKTARLAGVREYRAMRKGAMH